MQRTLCLLVMMILPLHPAWARWHEFILEGTGARSNALKLKLLPRVNIDGGLKPL